MRSRLILGAAPLVAAIVATPLAASAGPVSKHPVVAGVTASPGRLGPAGGLVKVSGRVAHAQECKVVLTPAVAGTPGAFRCSSGQVSESVSFPADRSRSAHRYTVALVAAGAHGRSTGRASVTVAATNVVHNSPAPTTTTTVAPRPTTTTTISPPPPDTTTTTTAPPPPPDTTTTTAPPAPATTTTTAPTTTTTTNQPTVLYFSISPTTMPWQGGTAIITGETAHAPNCLMYQSAGPAAADVGWEQPFINCDVAFSYQVVIPPEQNGGTYVWGLYPGGAAVSGPIVSGVQTVTIIQDTTHH